MKSFLRRAAALILGHRDPVLLGPGFGSPGQPYLFLHLRHLRPDHPDPRGHVVGL